MEHEIIGMWAQVGVSAVGLGCIVWGLFSMKAAGKRRGREIDELATAFKKQGEAFDRQGEVLGKIGEGITEMLRRTGPA